MLPEVMIPSSGCLLPFLSSILFAFEVQIPSLSLRGLISLLQVDVGPTHLVLSLLKVSSSLTSNPCSLIGRRRPSSSKFWYHAMAFHQFLAIVAWCTRTTSYISRIGAIYGLILQKYNRDSLPRTSSEFHDVDHSSWLVAIIPREGRAPIPPEV